MSILSIDIGVHNLGYAIYDEESNTLNFDIYDVDKNMRKKDNIVMSRVYTSASMGWI